MRLGNRGIMSFKINLLKMGQCDVMGPEVFWMSHWNDWVQLYFWMAVIRGHGKTAIINTGPPNDLTALNERWSGGFGERGKLARQESERPLNALATLGIKPEDVDYVLITPIQIYATANIQLFCNAQICISKRGWVEDFHAEKFPMHVPREFRLSDETLRYLTFEGHERLRLLEDEDELMPGLRCFWAGVHHQIACSSTATLKMENRSEFRKVSRSTTSRRSELSARLTSLFRCMSLMF
jgi:glyoxylase-like metal-dependent hydrolase (beta-lactamase superfamily II)